MIQMSVKTVRASVIDIRRDAPTSKDELFVDTNSWRNFAYTRIRNPKPEYLGYLKQALLNGTTLYACGVTLIELASSIEVDEMEIFKASSPGATNRKIFRHEYPEERKRVVAEVKASWSQVTQVASIVDLNLNVAAVGRCLKTFESCPVDGYDLLLIEAMERRNVLNILTDDSDFAGVSGVRVFTANTTVLATARRQNRLEIR
jgi:predicted nucleic acid-binding protein